jgi:hypothetical protein
MSAEDYIDDYDEDFIKKDKPTFSDSLEDE